MSLSAAQTLLFEDTRQKICMLLLNGRVMTISQIKDVFWNGNPPRHRSWATFKHHMEKLQEHGMIEPVLIDVKSKYKAYKITDKGKMLTDGILGIQKKAEQTLNIKVSTDKGE